MPVYNFIYLLNKLLNLNVCQPLERSAYSELDDRLFAAASFVRPNARFCDVGTDHAYLPLALVREKRAECALACDVNERPCARARTHIKDAGFTPADASPDDLKNMRCGIAVMLTDGLCGVEDFAPTDIVVAGMGGELIIDILSASDYIKNPSVRLILQPMTRASKLRLWLYRNGFEAVGETVAESEGRLYQIICAQYTGEKRTLTEIEALCGTKGLESNSDAFRKFVSHELIVNRKRLDGLRRSAGMKAEAEAAELLCAALEELLK